MMESKPVGAGSPLPDPDFSSSRPNYRSTRLDFCSPRLVYRSTRPDFSSFRPN